MRNRDLSAHVTWATILGVSLTLVGGSVSAKSSTATGMLTAKVSASARTQAVSGRTSPTASREIRSKSFRPSKAFRGQRPNAVQPLPGRSPQTDSSRKGLTNKPPTTRTAMVIVVEENEAQSFSVNHAAFFRAVERILTTKLEDTGLKIPKWLKKLVKTSRKVRSKVTRAVRNGLISMLVEQARLTGDLLGSTPHRCLAGMLAAMSQDLAAGKKPGKVFLDRYGEQGMANCLREMAKPYYHEVVVLTDRSARFGAFVATMKRLHHEGYLIDLFLNVHGCGMTSALNNDRCQDNVLVFSDKAVTPSQLYNAFRQRLNLNAVYMTSCWGSNFNRTWVNLGARASNGARELNYYVLLSPMSFMHFWTKAGMSLDDAAAKSYRVERNLLNGKKFTVKINVTKKKKIKFNLGVTYQKIMNKALAKSYGENKGKPVDNKASSRRLRHGSGNVHRARIS